MDIALRQVSFHVQGRAILDGVTATIRGHGLTCLLGANGAGKTTLMRVLSGEVKPTSGQVLLGEDDLAGLTREQVARRIAVVPQGVPDPPHLTVRELVSLGRYRPARRWLWRPTPSDLDVVAQYIQLCRLDSLADQPVSRLSGGEKQRTWLAFALAQEKEFVLLDEALESLDFLARRGFLRLLMDVVAPQRGVLLVTHDLGLVHENTCEAIILDRGRLRFAGRLNGDLTALIGQPSIA